MFWDIFWITITIIEIAIMKPILCFHEVIPVLSQNKHFKYDRTSITNNIYLPRFVIITKLLLELRKVFGCFNLFFLEANLLLRSHKCVLGAGEGDMDH